MKRLVRLFPLFLAPVVLASCEGKPFEQEDFLHYLFPNPWDALAIFLAFIILLLVVFYFAYKPVKKLLKQRKDYVEGKIKNAEQRELDAEQKVKAAEKQIVASRQEAMEIVEQAKEDALKEKERIALEAKTLREEEVKKAKEQIAQEIEASKDEVHKEIVSVALDASKKVLSREVNSKDNEKLIDDFIKDLDDK